MNLCIVSEYNCIFDDFKNLEDSTTEETKDFITEW